MYRTPLLFAVAGFFVAANSAWGQTVPEFPVPPLFCAKQYVDVSQTDDPVIFLRNDCSEVIDWALCLRDGDMSASEVYDGTLEPGHEVYFEPTISRELGWQSYFSVVANYEGQELPWPEC